MITNQILTFIVPSMMISSKREDMLVLQPLKESTGLQRVRLLNNLGFGKEKKEIKKDRLILVSWLANLTSIRHKINPS